LDSEEKITSELATRFATEGAVAIPSLPASTNGCGLLFQARRFQPDACRRRARRLPMSPRPMKPSFAVRLSSFVTGMLKTLSPCRLAVGSAMSAISNRLCCCTYLTVSDGSRSVMNQWSIACWAMDDSSCCRTTDTSRRNAATDTSASVRKRFISGKSAAH